MKAFIGADFHSGHKVGLTPPIHQPTHDKNAPRHIRKQAEIRARLWDWFAENVKSHGPYDVAILNGDLIDGRGEKSGGTELLTTDRAEQVAMAVECAKVIETDQYYLTYGTPYHAGEQEDWEGVLAKELKARKIENEGHYNMNGLQVVARHFIGNSASPVSSKTALTAAQVRQVFWALHDQQPLANLIIRSHIHRCYNLGEPALNWQGWVTPGLQGLGTRFGTRQYDGLPVHFGFLVLDVESAEKWSVSAVLAPLVMQASDVTKL